MSDSTLGMIFMALAMLLLPIGDTFAKVLTADLHPAEVTLARLLAQALFLVPAALLLRHRLRGPMFSPVVALSGGLVMVTLGSLIWAFSVMPIATAIAIFFVEPLILTALVGPLLGEKVGARRMAAVGIGLIGAVIVIRPGGGFGAAALLPLLAAVAYALNMIVLRRASKLRSALTVQCGATFYACLGMGGLTLVFGSAGAITASFAALPPAGWMAILGAGAFAATSFVLIAEAFRRAEAGTLAPFQYLEIVGATAAGYLVFGDFPDLWTWVGIAIILGSGLYVFWRERLPANRPGIAPGRRRSRRIRAR
ncbi:MAG: DMT family transporter [Gammaproteobacteria bacterium]|uniref:EamA-like transporter family protein n=1 Tax=Marinovum algicola TaxID=42444 RepID=A0A975WE25_9RHOB|nr:MULTISPECIES: DMT family transporter [Marinovum]MDD9744769.1 DMT family transporter [Marinovum sp. PR37]SEK05275.1 EamA-like transporter family protein [Marinovum algicola]SLN75319.1 EamA-like transporter family protein [Marinovum algicola]